MRAGFKAIVFGLTALILCTTAFAGEQRPGYAEIAGTTVSCFDFRGRPVNTYMTSGLGDAGRSTMYGRIPLISLDKEIMGRLSPKLQVFFFLHECGHHTLGHMYNSTPDVENDADCWSIRTGRALQYFKREDVQSFGAELATSPGTKNGHLPGPQRAERLLKCFDAE